MTFKVGDKVKIKSDSPRKDWNPCGKMEHWIGKVMTIRAIEGKNIRMIEDIQEHADGWFWNAEDLEKVEESEEDMNKFSNSDIKDGMLIEVRCGKRYLWINGKPRQTESYVEYMKDDLKNKCNKDYDIVKVGYPNKKADTIKEMLTMDFSEVVWELEPVTKYISFKELESLLKEKYPDFDAFNILDTFSFFTEDGETK